MKSFIKVMFFIVVMISIILPCISFAEEDKGLVVTPIEVISMKNNKVLGKFTLTNDSDSYIPKVSYFINLDVVTNISGYEVPLSINDIPAKSVELLPREEKTIFFEYDIPENLPKREYLLYLRVIENNVTMDEWKKFTSLGMLGSGNEFIEMTARTFDLLGEAMKTFNITIVPEIKEEAEIKLSLKSSFERTITANPKVQIFNMTRFIPVISYTGESVTFEPEVETDFTLKIPALNNAGQYLVKVAMYDGDKQVSQSFELSCFVNGRTAEILNVTARLNEENEVIVKSSFLGNRLSSEDKEYELKYKVYNKDNNELLKEEIKNIKLNYNILDDEFNILDIGNSNIMVNLSIMDNETLLASHNIEVNKEKLTMPITKMFSDVTSEEHKDAIMALVDMGFLSGYPDGTFRPYNNITRAEFTVLATRLAKVEVKPQESKFLDVTEEYWAKDFINTAYKKRYLSGYGNGLFMPNNNVTYQEAVTILVNILGYPTKGTPQFKIERFNNLTWPNNYIEAGKELGLYENIEIEKFSWPATRQDISVLILNAYLNK